MKTDTTYILRGEFEKVLNERNLPTLVQSGFIRVDGPKGSRIYIAATKKVGRIDISGFEVPLTLGMIPHCGVFGRVKQQMRFHGSQEDVLVRFNELLDILLAQPEQIKEKKAAPMAPVSEKTEEKNVENTPDVESAEAKAKRMELIRKVAASKGVKVSKKVEPEQVEQVAASES
jgi:hypothetical protein